MAIIHTKNLGKSYFGDGVETKALHSINLDIKEGEFVAIMGPSGSGKSTLLHLLGFLDKPTHGTYEFAGKAMGDYSEDELAHIRNKKMGFVFQSFNLLPRTSVLDNVKLPLLYSDRKKRDWEDLAKQAITSVGLEHRMHYEPSQLSGGEKQRAAIARALVNHPEIIFADEPTGNLDSTSGKVVMEIIQKLNEDHGHTVILITHEQYTAEHAGRIIYLRDGTIESDKPVEHRRSANSEFIK